MTRLALILAATFTLAGCATLDGLGLENRVSCTKGGTTALYSSMYGPLGVTSKVAQVDADEICKKP